MAGSQAPNKPVYYRSTAEIEARVNEGQGWSGDQFINGCNRGVANGAIGVNTGDYDPKETDFARIVHWGGPVSYIGKLEDAVADFESFLWGIFDTDDQSAFDITGRVGFDTAAADTADGADYGTLPVTNYTGAEIPADGWAWGFEAVGGEPVAPIPDAGGPYTPGDVDGTPNPAILSGSITAGTDTSPGVVWAYVSGVTGLWVSGQETLTPTFQQDSLGVTTVVMLAVPDDGPNVPSFTTITT